MKTPSEDLFQLIHSLKPQEKAYFKSFMGKMERCKKLSYSLFLFDYLNKISVYNEQRVKEELEKKFRITDFPKLKNSLISDILSALVEYHSNSSTPMQLNRMLSEVEVLISKNLLGKALTSIKKAKQIAKRLEHFDYLQLLLEFEQAIFSTLTSSANDQQKADILDERMMLLEKQKNLLTHQKNRDEIYAFYVKSGEINLPGDKKMIETALIKADQIPAPMSFRAKKQLLNSKAMGNYFLNNRKARYKYSKQFVDLYKKMDKEVIMEDIRAYIVGITYLISSQLLFSKYEEAEKTYRKGMSLFEALPSKKRFARIHNIIFALDINFIESLLGQLKFHKVIEIGESVYAKYLKNNLIDSYGLMHLCNYIAISNLYIENFKQSLKWLNKVLPLEGKSENRLSIISKIIRIIVHYELHNNDLVLSLAQSLVKKTRITNNFEKLFLNFCINKLPKIKSKSEEKDAFIALRSQLRSGRKNLFNKKETADFFNYEAWIDYKIQRRPLLDILKEKSAKRKI